MLKKQWALLLISGLLIFALSGVGSAHNNPTLVEELLAEIAVDANNSPASDTFSITLPKTAVKLIWRIAGINNKGVKFSVAQNDNIVVDAVEHDASSARLSGDDFTIVNVSGTKSAFTVTVYAMVLNRK